LLLNRICTFSNLKKIVAILLLSLTVFNLAGYRWLFSLLEEKATEKLEQKISAGDYQEAQLLEIRIPLSMPYYSDKEYENIYGETDWNGVHYRYVKRKVSGNTLYLLCLPNKEKSSLAIIKNEFTKAMNDVPANKQHSPLKNTLIKLLTTEFRMNDVPTHENILSLTGTLFLNKNSSLRSLFTPLTDTQPPEAMLVF